MTDTKQQHTCAHCGAPIRDDVYFDPEGRMYCSPACLRRGPITKGDNR